MIYGGGVQRYRNECDSATNKLKSPTILHATQIPSAMRAKSHGKLHSGLSWNKFSEIRWRCAASTTFIFTSVRCGWRKTTTPTTTMMTTIAKTKTTFEFETTVCWSVLWRDYDVRHLVIIWNNEASHCALRALKLSNWCFANSSKDVTTGAETWDVQRETMSSSLGKLI